MYGVCRVYSDTHRSDGCTNRRSSLIPLPLWEGLGEGNGTVVPSPPPNLPHQGGGIFGSRRGGRAYPRAERTHQPTRLASTLALPTFKLFVAPRNRPMDSKSTRIAPVNCRRPITEIRNEPTSLGVFCLNFIHTSKQVWRSHRSRRYYPKVGAL